jgi:SAM-dependent methyltransferase
MPFIDQFSEIASDYARYRPRYPESLFRYLSSLAPARGLAWDCGTGNGQAAIGLTPFFERVIATDASELQIANAIRHPKVTYLAVPAEQSGLEPGSVDLLTVTQALHWFDLGAFYKEVRRILKEGGVIGASAYDLPLLSGTIDPILRRFHDEIVGPMWLPQNRLVQDSFSTMPFPFEEVKPPAFEIRHDWNFEHFTGYLHTWSAVRRYLAQKGEDPVLVIIDELRQAWGESGGGRVVTFPLRLRVGHIRKG